VGYFSAILAPVLPPMPTHDPVIELDNAIATAYMLAPQIGADPPLINGRYELRRTLGRGANGLVCEALDRHLQRAVALKLVPLRDARTAHSAAREAQTLAQFDHANIVRIHDVGQASDVAGLRIEVVYVVMELLKGADLRRWAEGRPRPRAVLDVLLAAGEGLAAAHEQGFIHGDFKPENVVIDDRGRVRVVDFGLARWGDDAAVPAGAVGTARTLTQGPRGTPGYIAPEVFAGRLDARSDQFSFAVTLWELLLGRMPFDRSGETSAADLERSAADLAAPLARTLQRACAADPAARFGSMRELLIALRNDEPGRGSDVHARTGRWRIPVAGGLFAGAALVGGVALFSANDTAELWADATMPALATAPQTAATTATPATAPLTAAASAPPSCPEVAAITGKWDYTSAVMWAADARFLDERGFYRVEVTPGQGCRAAFHVVKHGDSSKPRYGENLEDRVLADVAPATDGAIEVTLDLRLAKPSQSSTGGQRSGLHYRQTLSWTGRQIRGDFAFVQAKTRAPELRGLLVGAAEGEAYDPAFSLAQATCAGQCRVRCAGDAAAGRCIRDSCRDAGATAPLCGAADDDFEPPSSTLQPATAASDDPPRVTPRCRQVAQRLPGRWAVWKRPRTGEQRAAERFELALESAGCELWGRLQPPSGPAQDVLGRVDASDGVWRLDGTDWALTGWDPAFGAADGGRATLAAHRLPPG